MPGMWDQAFCYITDLHLTERRPRFRKDHDYFSAQLSVLKQVTEECRKRDVRTIICGGDVMDRFNEFSWRIINEVRDVFKDFSVYTIIGNHDIPGGNLAQLDWCTVGLFLDKGVLKRLHGYQDEIPEIKGVIFQAADWGDWLEEALRKNEIEIADYNQPTILVAHSSIGPKKTEYCMGIDEINPPYDYVLLGDIHDGHETYVSPSGCRIVNPGSLGISNQKDADRPPRCVFIWPHERREEYCTLKFEEDQGFDKKRIAEYQAAKAIKFTRALAQAKAKKKGLTGPELVKEVGKKGRFSKCQIDLLLSEMSLN